MGNKTKYVVFYYIYTIHLFLSWAMLSRSELRLFFKNMYFLLFEYSMGRFHFICLYHSIYHLSFSLQFLYKIACILYIVICSLTSMKIVYISIYFKSLTFPLLDACWLKSMEMDLVKRKFCVFSTHAVMLSEASMKPQHICIN